ncbi:hypothetical protein CFC21_004524 [Triticum aestivum]|uniref:Uncharacterized protein n=1 Tax=Triticum aestivum TaxID=4565 RepID=A0A3B5Y7Y9_WHEAT|nr:uncharacterized protein LOC123183254 [Triticum aestivum]KAF6986804.1 hypothetical protein CFC21_004524 [Triticum aestivum]
MEEPRWLGGSLLQRTQAAVMPSRFMRSRQLSSEHARAHSRRQILQKEDELHDALSKANEQHLSAQATQKRPFNLIRLQVYSQRARGVLDLACKVTLYVYGGAFLLDITGAGRMLGLGPEINEDNIQRLRTKDGSVEL